MVIESEERKNRLLETAIAAQGDNKTIQEALEKLG